VWPKVDPGGKGHSCQGLDVPCSCPSVAAPDLMAVMMHEHHIYHRHHPDHPPSVVRAGIGAQGGDLEAACLAGLSGAGSKLLLPISRGISKVPSLKSSLVNGRFLDRFPMRGLRAAPSLVL
jgi:hypothetical protein